ncbi:DUF951 domain-containing protein [Lagierella sp.]|uniref:DUF951 domain-containing protein n=1 Tax=Lagierella sp. TaxID=2849657 RepID=UPI00260978F4|nr:DUF951 domain-containing protein [Lagierella sp.]
MKYKVDDIITLKKGHPCGENIWKITRTGMDIKLECQGCKKSIWMERPEFERKLRRIKDSDGKFVSIIHYEPEE